MKKVVAVLLVALSVVSCREASAMHVMEGFLPRGESFFWFLLAAPVVLYGFWKMKKEISSYPDRKMLLALAGAFIFVLSALKIPSFTGSSSHPTGIGLAAILFGPGVAAALSVIVLLFQALLLAHGGLTTLGANVFSMGVVGGLVGWLVFRILKGKGNKHEKVAVFFAVALSDWATYITTSVQLAWAFPDSINGFYGSLVKFMSIFAVTQIPLAIIEGLLAVVVYNTLLHYGSQGILSLWWRDQMDQAVSFSKQNMMILVTVVGLTVLPLFFLREADFGGADGKAQDQIQEIAPDYEPWYTPKWEPSGETESLIFALQAAIGSGIIFYAFGYWRGKKQKK